MKKCYVVTTGLKDDPNKNIRGVYSDIEIAYHEVSHYVEQERQAGEIFTEVILDSVEEREIAVYVNGEYAIVVEVWYMNQPIQQRC